MGSHPGLSAIKKHLAVFVFSLMAERVGFEPTEESPLLWFSRPVPSTTRPPLHNIWCFIMQHILYHESCVNINTKIIECCLSELVVIRSPRHISVKTLRSYPHAYKAATLQESIQNRLHFGNFPIWLPRCVQLPSLNRSAYGRIPVLLSVLFEIAT